MAFILTLLFIFTVAALAPRFGTDSRNLSSGRPDNFSSLPDHDWAPQAR